MKKSLHRRNTVGDTYFALVSEFPLVEIRDDDHLEEAIAFLDKVMDGPRKPGAEQYIEVLGDLIEIYEDKHVPMPYPGDDAMLEHLMEAKAVNQTAVSDATGIAKSTLSEILSGERRLTRTHIEKLARYFSVRQAVFVAD